MFAYINLDKSGPDLKAPWIFGALAVALFLYFGFAAPANATGFRMLEANGLEIGVWYPSNAPEEQGRLGPFDVSYAFASPPLTGRYQTILLSHGHGGRYRNHHLTAKALADAGFIVIAPNHTADSRIGGASTAAAMDRRISELSSALDAVLQVGAFRAVMDLSRVHALGYSLGAATVLEGAGASVNIPAFRAHCARNAEKDPDFCAEPSQVQRIVQWVRNPVFLPNKPDVFFKIPFINGDIVLVAPIGQGIEIQEGLFQARRVFVIGIDRDAVAVPQYHAQRVAQIIPDERLYDFVLRPGHHFAFIAPFPKWLTDEEDIPVANDPPGFDRAMFIAGLNKEIVAFFTRRLDSTSPE